MNKPTNVNDAPACQGDSQSCLSIEWYAEGQTRIVAVEGVQISIRFIGRKGRRGRIAVTAPAGAVFQASESAPSAANSRCG